MAQCFIGYGYVPGAVASFTGRRMHDDGGGHSGAEANILGNSVERNPDREALSEANPAESRVDIGDQPVCALDGLSVGNGAGNAVDVPLDVGWKRHQPNGGAVALVQPPELRLLKVTCDIERVTVDRSASSPARWSHSRLD